MKIQKIVQISIVLAVTCTFVSPVLALPVITNVVETGGDNEATDTIPAKWTGTTFPVSVANEPVPGLVIGNNFTVGLFGNGAAAFVDRNHRYSNHSVDAAAVPPGFTIPAYLIGGEYILSGNDNRDNARLSTRRDCLSAGNGVHVDRQSNERIDGSRRITRIHPPSMRPTCSGS